MIDYFDEIELIIYFKNTSEKTEKEITKKLKNVLKEFPGLTFYTDAKADNITEEIPREKHAIVVNINDNERKFHVKTVLDKVCSFIETLPDVDYFQGSVYAPAVVEASIKQKGKTEYEIEVKDFYY